MNFGRVKYIEGKRIIEGELVLDEARLCVAAGGILTSTYIPLDKIILIRKKFFYVEIQVKFSAINSLFVRIVLPRRAKNRLLGELVSRLNLKKRFFKGEWQGEARWR